MLDAASAGSGTLSHPASTRETEDISTDIPLSMICGSLNGHHEFLVFHRNKLFLLKCLRFYLDK